jgi:Rrf2 family iron-sulfur cluster assembly transcriptional regulator
VKLELLDRTDLAVRALRLLADGGRTTARVLAEQLTTSPGFLTQVLKPLVDAGILGSERGPAGGFALAVDPARLTMLTVIEAVEGPTDDGRCVLQNAPCPREDLCAIHDAWTRARQALLTELATTPLLERSNQEVST